MRRTAFIPAWLGVALAASTAIAGFDDDFSGRTLRVDFFHSGTAAEEQIALDRARVEGPWPGSRTQLIDPTALGNYRVEVSDAADDRLLYTHGFAGIFGEWATTGEAIEGTWRTFPEAVRVPEPRRPVKLRILKRRSTGEFVEIRELTIDPASRFVDRPPEPRAVVQILAEHGPPAVKVDLLVLGDGYAASDADKFRDDARRLSDALFKEEPFASRREDFNIRAIHVPAEHSGISRPRSGRFRDSPLGTRYNSFDSERYVLTLEDRRWRDVAAAAPYDAVLILVNERKYGGGGIFNLYATAAADSAFAEYLVVHEFGHGFAGLADEYYTSPVAYEASGESHAEPWEPNVTALRDPTKLKWLALADGAVPLPTPWNKTAYEKQSRAFQERRAQLRREGAPEERLEAIFAEEREWLTREMKREPHSGTLGAFEGAMYQVRGLYRPSVDCIMFSRDDVGFCPVCRRAIDRVIDLHTK